MDFRLFSTAVPKIVSSLGLTGDCDGCITAGGAKDLAQLELQLALSIRLHQTVRVILTVHEDCGAGATIEDLRAAAALVKEKFPACSVECYLMKLDGAWERYES